jgi:DnaD/phage-associated family protein
MGHHSAIDHFLGWEAASRDTIDLKRCYVDVAGGLVPGLLLSQIIYWHLPKNGKTKLRVERDGRMWLAKRRTDWFDECRLTAKQFDRGIRLLRRRGLVTTGLFKFAGNPMVHIAVNFEVLIERLDSVLPKGENPISPEGNTELPLLVNTSTENTTETNQKTATGRETHHVLRLFKDNIQRVTPQVKALLSSLIESYGEIWVQEAIKEAINHNHLNLAYIRKILETWRENGGIKAKHKRETNSTAHKRKTSLPALSTTEELVEAWGGRK